MNAKISKFMAVAITAMFCITAVAVFAVGEDSSAATADHKIYIEVVGTDGAVTESAWVQFTSDGTADGFVKEANKAFALYGYSGVTLTMGDYVSLTYNGSINNATYASTGTEWTVVMDTAKEYPAAAYLAFCLNNGYTSTESYNAFTNDVKASWKSSGMGSGWEYIKAPEGKTSECPAVPAKMTVNCYVEVISAAGAVTETAWVEFDIVKTNKSFITNANAAFATADLGELVAKENSRGGISFTYDGSVKNSMFYGKDGAWTKVTDTKENYFNESIAIAADNGYISEEVYNKLSADAKNAWVKTEMSGEYQYQKSTIDAALTPEKVKTNCYMETIDEKGKVTGGKWIEINAVRSAQSFIYNANKAFESAGFEGLVMSNSSWGIGMVYNGSYNLSTYFVKDGKWTIIEDTKTDYLNDTIAIAIGGYISTDVYNALSEDAKKDWNTSGMGSGWEYVKVLSESVDGYKSASSDNNTGLIIGVVVVIVIVVAIGAFVFFKKK